MPTLQDVLKALELGDAETALAIIKEIIAAAPPADEPAAPPASEMRAASQRLTRLTGKTTIGASIAEVETWRASHIQLETATQKLAEERRVLDSAERRKLSGELVTLAGRTPASVWSDPMNIAAGPKAHYQTMPIEAFRSYVEEAINAKGGRPREAWRGFGAGPVPPVTPSGGQGDQEIDTEHGPVTVTASEVRTCKEVGAKIEVYATNKAYLLRRHGRAAGAR
jgi:hypothetical protein